MTRSLPSRRFSAATIAVGIALVVTGLLGPATGAGAAGPAVFGPGYDTYLKDNQRGISSGDVQNLTDPGDCPSADVVEGMTIWHFILDGNDHDWVSIDVAFTVDASDFTLAGLTPKTTAQWASFDPASNFIASPTGKHAYVYTSGVGGTVRDAAGHVTPDEAIDDFQLSHVCLGEGGTTTTTAPTTTTTAPTTTTTAPTTTTEPTTTTTEPTTTTTEPTTTTTEPTTTTTTEPTTTTTEPTTTTTEGTTTTTEATTTTEEATTTTASISGSSTSETVGGVQVNQPLPTTGAPDRLLAMVGGALVLAGALTLLVRRRLPA